jgi:5-methylcytosine-specific restriction enzyme B
MTQAEQIRDHLLRRYIAPARRKGQTFVTITAGDVHKELGLRNRVPSVCQVMESRLLEREGGVRASSKQGPPSGR